MVKLPESFKAFQYQTGIDRIRDAYRASAAILEKAHADATQAYADYDAIGIDGDVHDADGTLIGSIGLTRAQAEMDAFLQVSLVREAFVTTTFHYWERSAKVWTGIHGFTNFRVLSARSAMQYPLSPQLETLNRLNNLLKHDTARVDPQLVNDRPDYFCSLLPPKPGSTLRKPKLQLQHEHVEEAFEIVRASGPTYQVS
ncbi:hypothetical protein [Sinorhizobium sojae]|uniref:hypothetical protein n=1 Tax=Sinorhizobium sojae TaxID=716925 RepID=UPI00054D1418|nr:hypothetical protein [Sinorhizobium sojae]